MALRPEAQTLLMVVASVLSGNLAISIYHSCVCANPNSPSTNTDLPSWGLPHTGLNDVAHVDLLDLFRLQSALLQRMLDGSDTELRGGLGGERPVEGSNGGTRRTDNVDGLGGLGISFVFFFCYRSFGF